MWWITLLETAATWSLHLTATSPEMWPGKWGTFFLFRFQHLSSNIFSFTWKPRQHCSRIGPKMRMLIGWSLLPLFRWPGWWWTRMEKPTTCCREPGMRRWSFHGWCRAAEEEKTARKANRKPSIKPSKLERFGGGTHSRKCRYRPSECVTDSVWLFGVFPATVRGLSPCTTSPPWPWL